MIVVDEIEQLSEEWFEAKLGVPSASHFDLIITTEGKPSESAEKYMYRLAYERITGKPASTYMSYDMKRGIENEPAARLLYEILYGVDVRQVALCYLDEQRKFGSSPDGLVGDDGGLEIKDAKPEVQIERLLHGWSKRKHFQQIQGNLLVTGRKWWDRMSHCPGLKPLFHRYERDEPFLAALRVELESFCERLDETEKQLREL
jgi:hypothetical protein